MKNKIKLLLVFSAMLIFSSCKDYLTENPESVLTQVDFYTTPTRINQGIIGCYAGMANVMQNEWYFTENRSDNSCVLNTGTAQTLRVDLCDLKFFRPSTSLPMIQSFWYNLFQNISNVNAVLPSVKDNVYLPTETQRTQYEAELLFIRAFHYYTLVNLFGDMFKVTSVIGPSEAKKMPRSPVSEIYNEIIIPDLIKAAAQAPSSYSGADVGRITKWAAKSLLAKAYMMIGGTDNLAKAKVLLQEVMAVPTLGLVTGTGAYASIFSTTNEMNKEIIFAVRYSGGTSGIGSPFWGNFAPEGSANLFLKIGTPAGNNNPTFELMNVFNADPKDTRKDACFKVWVKSVTALVPYCSKYIDASMTQAFQSENDWIVIRYADIVLLYAEILAQDGNYAVAHTEVNKIRTRSGLDALAAFTSSTTALDAVYKERRLELAFEDQRWFDLLRMAKSYNSPNKAVDILKTHIFTTDWTALYSLYTPILIPDTKYFNASRLLLPIPQTEIDTNNELKINQNTDY